MKPAPSRPLARFATLCLVACAADPGAGEAAHPLTAEEEPVRDRPCLTCPRIGTTYFVKATGDDGNSGLSDAEAWRTMAKVSAMRFSPGDRVLLKRGDAWDSPALGQSVQLHGNGTAVDPIRLGAYGSGPKPRIVGTGVEISVLAVDVEHWRIRGLQLENAWRGIELRQTYGVKTGIVVSDVTFVNLKQRAPRPTFTNVGAALAVARRGTSATTTGLVFENSTVMNADMGFWAGWDCTDGSCTGEGCGTSDADFPLNVPAFLSGARVTNVQVINDAVSGINGFFAHRLRDSQVTGFVVASTGNRPWLRDCTGGAGVSIGTSENVVFDGLGIFNVHKPENDGVGFDCSYGNVGLEVKNSTFENLDGQGVALYNLQAESTPGCTGFSFHDSHITHWCLSPQAPHDFARSAISLVHQRSTGEPFPGNFNTGSFFNVNLNRVNTACPYVYCSFPEQNPGQCHGQVSIAANRADVVSHRSVMAASGGSLTPPAYAADWNWGTAWTASSPAPQELWMMFEGGAVKRLTRVQNSFDAVAPWRFSWGASTTGTNPFPVLPGGDLSAGISPSASHVLQLPPSATIDARWVQLKFTHDIGVPPSSQELVVWGY